MSTATMKEPLKVKNFSLTLGADPEIFINKAGKIVGSEKVIDIKNGLKTQSYRGSHLPSGGAGGKVIVDGVQLEFNPPPATCREILAASISDCFRDTWKAMQAKDKELGFTFEPVVEISKEELDTLDEKSKTFGCAPSKNKGKERTIKVNAEKYKFRPAGGHIHIGHANMPEMKAVFDEQPERVVKLLDIIVGNTCVLIDRNPGNVERRKHYGKAGEYRTPPHGLEYRTLSNFWLYSYPLMSFVMSLTRFTVSMLMSSGVARDFEKEILKAVNMKDIEKAINKNDFNLAMSNFKKIEDILCSMSTQYDPINKDNIFKFHFFVNKIKEHGLAFWFTEDPVQHWINLPNRDKQGWENFMLYGIKDKAREEFKTVDLSPEIKALISAATGI